MKNFTIKKEVSLDITFDDLMEMCLKLPVNKQADLIESLFEYDSLPALVVKKLYDDRTKTAVQFKSSTENEIFGEPEREAYLQIAKDYETEAAAWGNLLKIIRANDKKKY